MNKFSDFLRKIFLREDEYQVKFDLNKRRNLLMWWSAFGIALGFKLLFWVSAALFGRNGIEGLILLNNLCVIALLLFPGYKLLVYFMDNLDHEVAFKFKVMDKLRIFCVNNKFVTDLGYCPEVLFSFDNDFLVVKFRLDGSEISKKFVNLGEQLNDMFILPLDSFNKKSGYAVYMFRRSELKRESVADILNSDNIRFVKDSIVLSDRYTWNFRTSPHGLITGITGSGKTFLFAYLIIVFIKIKASFRIIDPKRADLAYLEKYFGDDVVFERNQAMRILREAYELIDARMSAFKQRDDYKWGEDYSYYKVKPFFIIFDEAAAFVATLDKKLKEEYDKYIVKIILEGRQAGVFLIFAMQRPDAGEFIKGSLRDQLGLRIILSQASADAYKMVFGDSGKGLVLEDVNNGFVRDLKMLNPVEFMTPYLDIDFIPVLEDLIGYRKENIDLDKKVN